MARHLSKAEGKAFCLTKPVKLSEAEKAELGGPISEDLDTELTIEDLVDTVRLHCNLSALKARKVVYAILWKMIQELRDGGQVRIPGFGKLWIRRQKPYVGRTKHWFDPKGCETFVEGAARVFFTPSEVMLAELNPHLYVPREEVS